MRTIIATELKPGTLTQIGAFQISISRFDSGEIAIISARSSDLKAIDPKTSTSKRIKKIARECKSFICDSDGKLFMRFITPARLQFIIDTLQGKKTKID